MYMRTPLPLILALGAGFWGFGCEDTAIGVAPADVGLLPVDGGNSGPLPLEVGMMFTYQAILTAREDQTVERNSVYNLTLTISAIDEGAGTLSFQATGDNMLLDDWTQAFDFSAWVGRLGPSLAGEQVTDQEVTVDLVAAPTAPARPNPKIIPTAGPFFFDVRQIEVIRSAFSDLYPDGQPMVAGPAEANGRWRFSFSRVDANVITYNDQRRQMVLEYDPRGFLVRMTETIGQISNPPAGDFRLELQSGP